MDMGGYAVTYLGDSAHPLKPLRYYKIHYKSKDGKEEFTLMPNSFVNYKGNEGLMSNPDARHYLTHDVFTYITSIANPDKLNDTAALKPYQLKVGDTLFYSAGLMILKEVKAKDSLPEQLFGKDGSLHEANLEIHSKSGSVYTSTPRLAFAKGEQLALTDTVMSESLVLQLRKVNMDNKSIELGMKESNAVMDYITMKAYKFPFIKLLWFGVGITAIGILMSMVQRVRENQRKKSRVA
jgi:cytochrome c-type biogenesis protein CcmF